MAGEERDIKVHIDNVKKTYMGRTGEVVALNGVNLDIANNEFVTVVGPSGCGKSTLLNIIAGLLEPSSGTVTFREAIGSRSTGEASMNPFLNA